MRKQFCPRQKLMREDLESDLPRVLAEVCGMRRNLKPHFIGHFVFLNIYIFLWSK